MQIAQGTKASDTLFSGFLDYLVRVKSGDDLQPAFVYVATIQFTSLGRGAGRDADAQVWSAMGGERLKNEYSSNS